MLIGLNGRKTAGKDTVYERAAHIMADLVEVERVSFADLLYKSAAEALGVNVETLQVGKSMEGCKVQVTGPFGIRQELTFREYLQRYGTEAHRDVFGPDFWVDNVNLEHAGRIVFVTDVRFPNEANAVTRAGGIVCEVLGPPDVQNAGDGHASEAPLAEDLVDYVLSNGRRDDNFKALDEEVSRLIRWGLNRQWGTRPHVYRPGTCGGGAS